MKFDMNVVKGYEFFRYSDFLQNIFLSNPLSHLHPTTTAHPPTQKKSTEIKHYISRSADVCVPKFKTVMCVIG